MVNRSLLALLPHEDFAADQIPSAAHRHGDLATKPASSCLTNEKPAKGGGSFVANSVKKSVVNWRERCCEEILVHFADLFGFGNERFVARLHMINASSGAFKVASFSK
jgi:hypothetical protein